jgi:nucleoside-diphosphate-sugar epimerase
LSDGAALERAIARARAVLCLAGATPRGSPAEQSLNSEVAGAVLAAAGRVGSAGALIFASSSAVYAGHEGALVEDARLQPGSEYGRGKLEMEQVVGAAGCCLRIGNVVGADALLGQGRRAISLHQFEDASTPSRNWIAPHQMCEVIAGIVGQELPQVLNVATPEPVEMGVLAKAAGCEGTLTPAPEGVPAQVHLDLTALKKLHVIAKDASTPEVHLQGWDAGRMMGA